MDVRSNSILTVSFLSHDCIASHSHTLSRMFQKNSFPCCLFAGCKSLFKIPFLPEVRCVGVEDPFFLFSLSYVSKNFCGLISTTARFACFSSGSRETRIGIRGPSRNVLLSDDNLLSDRRETS